MQFFRLLSIAQGGSLIPRLVNTDTERASPGMRLTEIDEPDPYKQEGGGTPDLCSGPVRVDTSCTIDRCLRLVYKLQAGQTRSGDRLEVGHAEHQSQ